MILGLNKYTHSAAACLLDEKGRILFAQSKERVSRKKHDGGDVAELVRYALERTGRKLSEISFVAQNNHLFSIEDYENSLPFTAALHAAPTSSLDKHNLFPNTQKIELSHHLSHAWSVTPFLQSSQTLIVVMDGMGSPASIARAPGGPGRSTDGNLRKHASFREFPQAPVTGQWREAESVYLWRDGEIKLLRKRWIRERSPSFLYNYGFENMESLGALYSRISSHIFGDWNQCGKVMGLAAYGTAAKLPPLFSGPLESLRVNWKTLESLPHPNAWNEKRFRGFYENLAARIQTDLERTALDFLRRLQRETGVEHLAFTGGVALNSLLNGRIAAQLPFRSVFIPPFPGDEGVAVGCAYFAHAKIQKKRLPASPPSPYLGAEFSKDEMRQALEEYASWIEFETAADAPDAAAQALAAHQFIAWFQARSEFGPRALGNRSILAHPGRKDTWRTLNESVKKREGFRPFAPAIRAEAAARYFRLAGNSRYMSLTVPAKTSARAQLKAVVHVDGSSRIQIVNREDNPRFDDLLLAFERRTKLPVLLNTSFNIAGEPMVESPRDAIRSLLDSQLDVLVLGNFLVRRRPFPPRNRWRHTSLAAAEDFLLETRQHPDGSSPGVQIFLQGQVHELHEIETICLEEARNAVKLTELIRKCRTQSGASEKEVVRALERLWKIRAIRRVL